MIIAINTIIFTIFTIFPIMKMMTNKGVCPNEPRGEGGVPGSSRVCSSGPWYLQGNPNNVENDWYVAFNPSIWGQLYEICFVYLKNFLSVSRFGCKGVQQGGGEGGYKEDGGGDETDEKVAWQDYKDAWDKVILPSNHAPECV